MTILNKVYINFCHISVTSVTKPLKRQNKYVQDLNFGHLLKANKETIYRICRIYAVSPIEPQDLFQEVTYQIWKSLKSFKGKSNINTWIYRIALNVCMSSKLKLEKKREKTVRFDAIQFKASNDSLNEEDEKYKFLKECITTLNESDTSIIVLYLEELSYKQIAEITGLTENHIAVKMKRIRKKLFDCINPKLS
ncbi:sigma-70 family RNA polymerase sigma factor [Winogradskyella sp. E313]|uniref:Sigma-70 family RNA polymerase sigma factor n=1 Tax=Winogradskyella immobilis TaxID=2816852 RepID=A0ABS8EP31_9FLAO|nr:sigma-70 family RNA polymerase sigma factor [Winogradskyella immobilis]MCC1484062.1 sigma-70 family RNA polymerase sigma factor [Winogradskyella immobilis]MCG0016154.1 sigma-70 family RNA polymerase sigma factor [Winogradskyella immobilis]